VVSPLPSVAFNNIGALSMRVTSWLAILPGPPPPHGVVPVLSNTTFLRLVSLFFVERERRLLGQSFFQAEPFS